MPVKRWIPRPSGLATPTSESHSSCSSPPPTSTAPDLGQLAALARQPVGLGVERDELGGGERMFEHGPRSIPHATGRRNVACSRITVRRRAHASRRSSLLAVMAGCGGSEQRENELRPPVPVVMTAAIQDDVVRVSPRASAPGTITLVVSNQTDEPQTVTFETDELGGERGGNRASSPRIAAEGHRPPDDRRPRGHLRRAHRRRARSAARGSRSARRASPARTACCCLSDPHARTHRAAPP